MSDTDHQEGRPKGPNEQGSRPAGPGKKPFQSKANPKGSTPPKKMSLPLKNGPGSGPATVRPQDASGTGSANVDNYRPRRLDIPTKAQEAPPSSAQDTSRPAPQGTPPARHASNVDNQQARSAPHRTSSNVDNDKQSKPASPQAGANVDKKKGLDIGSLSFPSTGPSSERREDRPTEIDPAHPSGPSKETIRRIRRSKQAVEFRNQDLDQSADAQSSRASPSRFARKNTTMSAETSQQYLNRGRLLISRYKREQAIDQDLDDFDAKEFVIWLLSLRPTIKASTWRVYRQAAYVTLMGKPDDDIEIALDMLDNDIVEGDERSGQSQMIEDKRNGQRTSAHKEKRFPKADFEKYLAYLQYVSRSKDAALLTDWLVASIFTGLRPIEWQATDFQTYQDPATKDQYVWLYVLNAKTTNERGNGIIRTLDLSDLPVPILNAIKRMSEKGLALREEGRFGEVRAHLSRLLYDIGEKLYPRRKKHFALYSCRHQFIANMKTLMKPEEVSALSGHRVTKTAKQNYGKAKSAWAPEELRYHAKPIEDEVATVKLSADFYNERVEKLRQAGLLHGNTSGEME